MRLEMPKVDADKVAICDEIMAKFLAACREEKGSAFARCEGLLRLARDMGGDAGFRVMFDAGFAEGFAAGAFARVSSGEGDKEKRE